MSAERMYALTRIRSGDYICQSNDGRYLWRFQRYIDGRKMGLDVIYEEQDFWRALRTPADLIDLDAVDDQPWQERAQWLPTRRAAIDYMLGDDA